MWVKATIIVIVVSMIAATIVAIVLATRPKCNAPKIRIGGVCKCPDGQADDGTGGCIANPCGDGTYISMAKFLNDNTVTSQTPTTLAMAKDVITRNSTLIQTKYFNADAKADASIVLGGKDGPWGFCSCQMSDGIVKGKGRTCTGTLEAGDCTTMLGDNFDVSPDDNECGCAALRWGTDCSKQAYQCSDVDNGQQKVNKYKIAQSKPHVHDDMYKTCACSNEGGQMHFEDAVCKCDTPYYGTSFKQLGVTYVEPRSYTVENKTCKPLQKTDAVVQHTVSNAGKPIEDVLACKNMLSKPWGVQKNTDGVYDCFCTSTTPSSSSQCSACPSMTKDVWDAKSTQEKQNWCQQHNGTDNGKFCACQPDGYESACVLCNDGVKPAFAFKGSCPKHLQIPVEKCPSSAINTVYLTLAEAFGA